MQETWARSAGDPGSIPELGRSPGEGNGYPLQDSHLENPMDRGAWSPKVGHAEWLTLVNRTSCTGARRPCLAREGFVTTFPAEAGATPWAQRRGSVLPLSWPELSLHSSLCLRICPRGWVFLRNKHRNIEKENRREREREEKTAEEVLANWFQVSGC